MNQDLTKLEKIALVALQGLLASGHYTRVKNDTEDGAGEPEHLRYDHGKDWKSEGFPNRYSSHAASDAFIVARDFLKESEFWKDEAQK